MPGLQGLRPVEELGFLGVLGLPGDRDSLALVDLGLTPKILTRD